MNTIGDENSYSLNDINILRICFEIPYTFELGCHEHSSAAAIQ